MQKLKLFTHCILLATTPTLLAYPKQPLPQAQTVSWWGDWGSWWWSGQEKAAEWARPTTYDEIIQMLEDLDSGELERKYPPEQLERVNEYLAILAKEGILPNESDEDMAEDIEDLLYGEDSAFQLAHYLQNSPDYSIIPAILNGYSGYNIVQCGKISKAWKKTKKFVKDHKTEIIIGAVVVVAVVVVTVAVVVASSAAAASAAASAAGAAGAATSGSGSEGSGHSEAKKEDPPVSAAPKEMTPPVDTNEAPVMKAALDEHIASFKEFLLEDKAAQQAISSKGWDEMSFGEKAREVGAGFAHKALDEVSDLVKVVPQLYEEAKELAANFLPESLKLPNAEETGNSTENYENLVANGHKTIDTVFSTDQAELFTAEARANDPLNNFAIGMIPLPGSFNKIFSNARQFKEAGKILDRAGFTKSGRALMKHGNRKDSVFPKPLGNPAEMNRRGQLILEEILDDPNNQVYRIKNGGIKVYSSNGRGASFEKDGSFRGFVEKQYEKDIFN